ncbi:hypothetical protein [Neolewinella litorea]|uniref:Lipocalin-like domain-containing protein n=1 Tax=Neolewinella litorea TaxID=2562452 RepID=A0A4S4NMZ1_9BACT|nr:hypothetical protein [Neolewinella litorea]THH40337.1 hypothetical protein E4021_06275 [Neolewinella litorea]
MPRICFLICLFLTMSACSIEERIERREDRLTGSWQIERATFKGNNALFRDNITEEFLGDRVTFYPDYTLVYDSGGGEFYDGYWAINVLRERDEGIEFTFDADFFDFRGRPAFQWIGTIEKLNRNRFKVTVYERRGILQLRWEKL